MRNSSAARSARLREVIILWKAEEGVLGRPEAGGVFDADGGGLCGVTAFLFVLSASTPRLRSTTASHGSIVVRLAGNLMASHVHK